MVWLKCMVLMRWMSQFTDLNRLTLRILSSVCIYAGIFESLYISLHADWKNLFNGQASLVSEHFFYSCDLNE